MEKQATDGYRSMKLSADRLMGLNSEMIRASLNMVTSSWLYWQAMVKYAADFMAPSQAAAKYFAEMETERPNLYSPQPDVNDFLELLLFNVQMATRGTMAAFATMNKYHLKKVREALEAVLNSVLEGKGEGLVGYSERRLKVMNMLVNGYPAAIRDIEPEYGFHFDTGGYKKIAETDRFTLYQVLPTDTVEKVPEDGKPVLIIPPYVLGANVLGLLPGEKRSYAHAFANRGIPTYIRIVKNIETTPAVQLMTGEDDAHDTRVFAERLVERHQKKVTLNGYCQGGFMATLDLLSGELDGLIDALITCVAPMDGSRSTALVDYMEHLPERFRRLGYATKTLPNGNKVVDGKVMSWVYKLKSIETDSPVASFYRDLNMLDRGAGRMPKVNKIGAAINYWLTYDRTDLPLGITQLSMESYSKPISPDGTLPIKLFGRSLNFKRIKEKGIKWLICIAQDDDLVDAAAALAPLDYVDAEVSVFPKGHASIATSWSVPTSECALHGYCYLKSSQYDRKSRGPVMFHLGLKGPEEEGGDEDDLPEAA